MAEGTDNHPSGISDRRSLHFFRKKERKRQEGGIETNLVFFPRFGYKSLKSINPMPRGERERSVEEGVVFYLYEGILYIF